MRNFSKLGAVGTVGLVGIGLWTLPAAADSLAVDFSPLSTSYTSVSASNDDKGTSIQAYGYEFTAGPGATVTALGTFDNGSVTNIQSTTGDIISLYAGTIGGNAPAGNLTPLAQVNIGGINQTAGTVSQIGAWAFIGLTSDVSLTSGDSYFILTYYGNPNSDPAAMFPSTVTVNSIALTLGLAEVCQPSNTNCNLQSSGDSPGIFGPNFEIASPVPAALPLFAGGLGMLGLLGRLRKRKASAATAVA